MPKPRAYHVLDLFALPDGVAKLPREERERVVKGLIRTVGPEGFKKDANAGKAAITPFQEFVVGFILLLVMGGPFGLLLTLSYFMAVGSLTGVGATFLTAAILSMHPLPKIDGWLARSSFMQWVYRYFSYRFVWSDEAMELGEGLPCWIGAGAPHGVMPFANVLSIAAINSYTFKSSFVGAGAPAVFKTPMLRWMSTLGTIDVSSKSIEKALAMETSVGIVMDGIAGIFRNNHDHEVLHVKSRKGIAKLALRTGVAVIPAYSMGNTDVFTAWYDRWGIMESVSRKVKASLFFFWGRFGLPIPHRANVSLLFGNPIMVKKKAPEEITQADVDEVHQRLLDGIERLFNEHKDHLGYGHKQIIFEG